MKKKEVIIQAQYEWRQTNYKTFGEGGLDQYLYENYLKNIKKGFYIECGAANGIEQSNTAALNFHYGWKGILIEPNPFQYKNILKLRYDCFASNCALVSHEYTEDYIEGFFNADPRHLQGPLSDAEIIHLLENREELNVYNNATADSMCGQIKTSHDYDKKRHSNPAQAIEVPAKTLDWILDSYGIERADFFSLDVEGYEVEVLKGWSPFKYPIRYVLIETPSESSTKKDIINQYMAQHHYKIEEEIRHNTLYSLS